MGTEKEFGYEWSVYPELLPEHQEQFWRWVTPLGPDDFRGKRVLEAGCGMGRNVYWAMKAGAAEGRAVDFDERTLHAARTLLSDFPRCRVDFKSIYALGWENAFDLVLCVGVLHHLADPRAALENLVTAAVPGGRIVLWVYAREGNGAYLKGLGLLRFVLRPFPLPVARVAAAALSYGVWVWARVRRSKPYWELMHRFRRRHIEAIVFDQIFPSIAHYWTREELLALIAGLAVQVEHMTHTNARSWTLILKKDGGGQNPLPRTGG